MAAVLEQLLAAPATRELSFDERLALLNRHEFITAVYTW